MAPCLTPDDETEAAACEAEGSPGAFLGNSWPCNRVICLTSSLFRSSSSIILRSLDSHLWQYMS